MRKSRNFEVAIWAGVGVGVVCLGLAIWASQFWASHPTSRASQRVPPPAHSKAKVVAEYPHDEAAFTQGLLYHEGALFESTGQYGKSTLRRVRLETGEVLQQREIAPQYFAEGLALHDRRLIQLTWKEGTAFVYDVETMNLLGTLSYSGEGWGLASNGTELFFTDGTDRIRVMDGNLRVLRRINVRDGNGPVQRLNEVEWYQGTLLINVWGTDLLVQVDPSTGHVLAWVDCSGLLPAGERTTRTDVLNGIAYDAERDRLFVTGKYWPKLYQIELVKE
jgi:glutamine cyclotransferase